MRGRADPPEMWKDVERYPPGNESISHLGKRKIMDSKGPAGRGYVSSQEGIDFGKNVFNFEGKCLPHFDGIQLFWERLLILVDVQYSG